jgi:hypothetical protein
MNVSVVDVLIVIAAAVVLIVGGWLFTEIDDERLP